MNIIFGDSAAQKAQEKYIVLELDTFQVDEQRTTTYALVERVSLMEMLSLDKFKELLSTEGPMIIDCMCLSEQEILPAQALKDGKQCGLHDMAPFLSDEEMQQEMVINL